MNTLPNDAEERNMKILFGECAGPRALRERLWQNGYRPVMIRNGSKFPTDTNWHERAHHTPPACITDGPDGGLPWTGIITSGLRAIDIDVSDPDAAAAITDHCLRTLGVAPLRWRVDAPRVLLLYRAAEGAPGKVKVWNSDTKEGVEVLGHGQQFFAYGRHPSGEPFDWVVIGPHNVPRDDLTPVTEEQINTLLAFCEPFVGQAFKPTKAYVPQPMEPDSDLDMDVLAITLDAIPVSNDYDRWRNIGTAVHTVTGGTYAGLALFTAWSKQHVAYGDKGCLSLWEAMGRGNRRVIGMGTLVHHAKLADPYFNPTDVKQKISRLRR